MRVALCATGPFAVPILDRLSRLCEVTLVVSTPPAPSQAHRRVRPSPVAEAARARGFDVVEPSRKELRSLGPVLRERSTEVLFVADFGRILPPDLVASVPHAVNVHPSLLPRHRGAAPIVWTLWEGDAVTGVTLLGVGAEVDAAPIYDQVQVPVLPDDDAGSLEGRLAQLAADRVGALLSRLRQPGEGVGGLHGRPQVGSPTYARRLGSADEWLDLERGAENAVCQVRALAPEPGARIATAEGPLLVLWAEVTPDAPDGPTGSVGTKRVGRRVFPQVRAGDGQGIVLVRVRPAGRRTMDGDAYLRGRVDPTGSVWGSGVDPRG